MKKGSINPHRYRARIGNCLLCGKEYRAIKDFKEHKQKWCSKECWSKRATIVNKCLVCDKEIKTYKSVNQKFCGIDCKNKGMIGRKHSDITIKKMSDAKKGKTPKNTLNWKGEGHPHWKRDRSLIKITETKEYKELRLKVFKRDNYTCQECKKRGKKRMRIILEMHHIKSKKDFPELFWEISNCQTFCSECHKKTESYLKRWQ